MPCAFAHALDYRFAAALVLVDHSGGAWATTYGGTVVGRFIGKRFDSVGGGLLATAIASGAIIEAMRFALRSAR